MSSEKPKTGGPGLGLKLPSLPSSTPTTYESVRMTRSEPMGNFERGIGMPVGHVFESEGGGESRRIREVIEKVPMPGQHMNMHPLKYDLGVDATRQGGRTFAFRDEHVAPLDYFDQAKQQPLKPEGRRNQAGVSGGVRGDREPLKFKTRQVWTSDLGATIPHSGFEIGKKIWYEGQRQHPEGGSQFEMFKMRVTKEPKAVSINFQGSTHDVGPGGGGKKKHHLFVGVVGEGESRRIVTAKTRQGLIDKFRPAT
jgi:hypothetical protein